ncbi:DUF1330 domain-containing protein [Salinisphaera dokdonensis]
MVVSSASAQEQTTYYSILAVTPITDEWVADYIPVVNQRVAAHGGKFLARTSNHERLEGNREDAALQIIIEWPSEEAAKAFVSDEEYRPHLQARTEGSVSHHVLIKGEDALAD